MSRVGAFIESVSSVGTIPELRTILGDAAVALGFSYFALADHVDVKPFSREAIRIHNYPYELERLHDEQNLGGTDPVHRACQRTVVGFTWTDLQRIIQLTRTDLCVLEAAAKEGIGDGFTIPVHMPGECSGSCSFATRIGVALEADNLPAAQLVGTFAFEAARRLTRGTSQDQQIHLSDRERECLIWIARGKANSEIATILGISTHTVDQYVKNARAIFDVVSRSQLVARALFSGAISFLDVV